MNTAAQPGCGVSSVTAVVVSYNTRDWLRRCLESVAQASQRHATTTIVIDNASMDGSADLVADEFPNVLLKRNTQNVGFARAVNQATAAVASDYILLLNPDGFLHEQAIDKLVDFADAHPEFIICGGRTITPAGDLDPRSCWAAPSLWSMLCTALMISALFPSSAIWSPEAMGSFKRDHVREVDIVTGCLLLIRTSDWRELGGFDERYFVYGEDADLSLRASAGGRRCAITPDAVMVHAGGESADNDPHHQELLLAGRITLITDQWPRWKAHVGRTLIVTGVLIRAVIDRIANRNGTPVWPTVWKKRRNWWNGYQA